MIPVNKIENLIKIYADLEKELSSGSVDKKEYASKSKKYSSLESVINQAREYLNFEKEKIDLENIINDKRVFITSNSKTKVKNIKNTIDKLSKDLNIEIPSLLRLLGIKTQYLPAKDKNVVNAAPFKPLSSLLIWTRIT